MSPTCCKLGIVVRGLGDAFLPQEERTKKRATTMIHFFFILTPRCNKTYSPVLLHGNNEAKKEQSTPEGPWLMYCSQNGTSNNEGPR